MLVGLTLLSVVVDLEEDGVLVGLTFLSVVVGLEDDGVIVPR